MWFTSGSTFRVFICVRSCSSFLLLVLSVCGTSLLPFRLISFAAAFENAFYTIEVAINRSAIF
jgi:hypothetical protein